MNIYKHNISNAHGLSLVELMVAMTVSAILMLGISEIFSINSRSYKVQDENSRMQESARFALNSIMTDIRRAGYFGGSANTGEIMGSLGIAAPTTGCLTNDTSWARMIERPIFGLNDNNTGYACITNYTQGDILVSRYTKGAPIDDASLAEAANDNRLYIRNSMFSGTLFTGDTAIATSNIVVEDPKEVHELAANAYYVGPSGRDCRFDDANGAAIPVPALHRKYLSNAGRPVSEEVSSSIENIQFQYGIDTDGSFTVNQYLNADDISNDTAVNPNWAEIVSIRLWVLVRADCPTNNYTNAQTYTMGDQTFTPNDNFKRLLYSTTVAVRN